MVKTGKRDRQIDRRGEEREEEERGGRSGKGRERREGGEDGTESEIKTNRHEYVKKKVGASSQT